MKKIERKKWKVIAGVLLVLQAVFGIFLLAMVVKINMLPMKYVLFITAILFLMFSCAYLLLFARKKKGKKPTGMYVKRGLGTILSVFMIILGLVGTSVISKLDATIGSIVGKDIVTETTAIYVLKDDPAQAVSDIADYTLGYTKSYDWENTQEALNATNKSLDKDIATEEFDTVDDMVAALYEKSVGAILLNVAYEDVLAEDEDYSDFSDKVRRIFENEVEKEQVKTEVNDKIEEEPFVVYISGSDTRNKKLSTSRSDVNILAIVNPESKQILLLNTPRDYYVDISISSGSKDKLTHCGIYGIDCSMDTLGSLYGVDVDYYAQINFTGFEKLIDELGGVEVYSEKSVTTREGGFSVKKGMNHMSGEVALAFVRDRYSFADGDNARGRHQMAVIEAIIEKATGSTAIISNYSGIMDSIEGMFATNISSQEISDLVKMQLKDGGTWNIKSYAVTGKGASKKTYSMPKKNAYVMIPDQDSVDFATELIEKVFDGETLSDEDVVMP